MHCDTRQNMQPAANETSVPAALRRSPRKPKGVIYLLDDSDDEDHDSSDDERDMDQRVDSMLKRPRAPPPTSSLTRPTTPVTTTSKKRRTVQMTAASVTPSPPPKKKRSNSNYNKQEPRTTTTHSFDALWAGTVGIDSFVQIHTLILGTHPSVTSLEKNEYFSYPVNSFWWMAGDCLRFRRSKGKKQGGQSYLKLCDDLRYDDSHVIPYQRQVEVLCGRGFALWDIVAGCQRRGSLDSAIQKGEVANDIRWFAERHPSIRRIVMANGTSGKVFFQRHFADWWESGQLKTRPEVWTMPTPTMMTVGDDPDCVDTMMWEEDPYDSRISCVVAISPSPAASTYSYKEKRDWWEQFVYKPGLKMHFQNQMFQAVSI